jgi:Arylsulfotransferase (ASST)
MQLNIFFYPEFRGFQGEGHRRAAALIAARASMNRNGLVVLLLAAVAWVVVAVVLGTGSLSGAHTVVLPNGVSPACLPATLSRSAELPGTAVEVSPAPETDTANRGTQISFLGRPVTDIQDVSVEGSRTGYHHGHLYGYFQGDGGSFVPDKPFDAGERVLVRALLGTPGVEHRSSFSFHVASAYPTGGIGGFPNPSAPASSYQSFVSAPGLHPPILDVTAPDRDPKAGDVLMTVGPGPGQFGPLIYSPQGRLVWFDRLADGRNALDLSVQRYEGQNDLTWWQGRVLATGFGEGEDIVMDPNYQTVATIRAGNGYGADLHDFQIAPRQVAYITVYNTMRCDLSPVGGARNGVIVDTAVQALDMKTGLVRWEWHSLDHVGVSESHAPVPTDATPWDWFHLNSVDPEPGGQVLISGRSTWAAYQLEGPSGKILWQLGGTKSSFTMGPGAETAWQHDARMQPDGTVTLFDDGSDPRVHYQSRGVRVAIDLRRHTARLAAVYPHPGSPLLADSQGNMQTLEDESVVIGWGAVPSVSQFARGGALLFDAHMPPGMSSYRVFRFPWVGHPLSAPSVSARVLATGDSTAVFASWNGATDVASWRVLAGANPASLTAQATMPDSGFESTVTYPNTYPEHKVEYVAVQALGAGGQPLGTSAAVEASKPVTKP